MQIVKRIKEATSFVSTDYEKDLSSNIETKEFELPDKTIIKVEQERFKCMEPLFKTALLEMEAPGVHQIVYDTVMKCDIDLRKEMFANVVLSGGTCSSPGFTERMLKELTQMVTTMKINIPNVGDRKIAVWRGSSIVAELSNFEGWVSVDDFLEFGPSCLDRKKEDEDDD